MIEAQYNSRCRLIKVFLWPPVRPRASLQSATGMRAGPGGPTALHAAEGPDKPRADNPHSGMDGTGAFASVGAVLGGVLGVWGV